VAHFTAVFYEVKILWQSEMGEACCIPLLPQAPGEAQMTVVLARPGPLPLGTRLAVKGIDSGEPKETLDA